MSIHLEAKIGDIAPTVLLPGDPLRAKHIAERFLEKPRCYNQVRGMLGFTGTYQGKPVSVQGTGMGVPSISIYVNELIREYGARTLIRVGTCGSIQQDVKVKDVILASAACTDSNVNRLYFGGMDFSPVADFGLLKRAHDRALASGATVHVDAVLTSDSFYVDGEDPYALWRGHGVLAVEMETAALYTLAARHQAKALSVLTASDHLLTDEHASAQERQTAFEEMMKIALETAVSPSVVG